MKSAQRKCADQHIVNEMAAYRAARAANDSMTAWASLERAHIISQPHLGPHLSNHWIMLQFAVAERNGAEVIGQIFRLGLAPLGSLTGRIPVGNTGRSDVSAFQSMPIPEDLASQMEMQ